MNQYKYYMLKSHKFLLPTFLKYRKYIDGENIFKFDNTHIIHTENIDNIIVVYNYIDEKYILLPIDQFDIKRNYREITKFEYINLIKYFK